MKALSYAAWGLFPWLSLAAAETPKVHYSQPVDPGLITQAPYRQTGMVMSLIGRGSGFVVSHRNLFFTAAHVLFTSASENTGATDEESGWQLPPAWVPAHNQEDTPVPGTEIPARGYFRWTLYSDLVAEYGQNSNMAFSRDAVLAWGLKPFIEGSPATLDTRGANKLRAGTVSMITGYPAMIDYNGEEGSYLMHATPPAPIRYRLIRDSYVFGDLVSTGPGNSGGPVWVQNTDLSWSAAGILVSGLAGEAGVYGMSPDVNRLLKAAQPVLTTPMARTRHINGVDLSTAVLTLPKPKKIPDGVKRWTVITFDLNDFPEDSVVAAATVNLDISTKHRGDLIVVLVAPGGTYQTLFNQEDADEDNLILEDEPVGFAETDEDSSTSGPRANGRWQLLIQDRLPGDVATLNRFELFLHASTSPTP